MLNPKVLVVDDEEDIRNILSDRLQMYNYEVLTAGDAAQAFEVIEDASPDLILLDIRLPDIDGIEVLKRIKNEHPDMFVIMITAYGSVQYAVDAMKHGAYDFIEKPFDADQVRMQVDNALERHAIVKVRSELKGDYSELIGKSPKFMDILRIIEKVAPSVSTVLITGESGTGKELIARALHRNSPRSSKRFVVVNSSAIQSTLLESEIFGHEKGSFTGATARKPGKMELADGGTLFFDEIGDMAYELQTKLLRAIQEKECERVGGTETIKTDVRFIAATNQDLQEAIQKNKFRMDLYYRLNVVNIHIPPIRERREDIPFLIDYFLKKYCNVLNKRNVRITDEAITFMTDYSWPGNVRELQNSIERMTLLADTEIICPDHLPKEIKPETVTEPSQDGLLIKAGTLLKDMEKTLILKTLEEVGGDRTKAARLLGISLRGLQYKLKDYMQEEQGRIQ